MNRTMAIIMVLLTFQLGPLRPVNPVSANSAAAPRNVVQVTMPASNSPVAAEWVASDSQLVYVMSDPLMVPPNDPNHGRYFKDFHAVVYHADLRFRNGHLTVSQPRLLFRGPKGLTLGLGSVVGGWLVYEQYDSYDVGGQWQIVVRNIATGKTIAVDSRDREGVPSLTPPPSSDGHTIAWQTWTRLAGKTTSVVRTYALSSGQRRTIATGGSTTTWGYFGAVVSGSNLVFGKELYETPKSKQSSQIMLADVRTGKMRALTAASGEYSEPWISGDLAAWKVGQRLSNGKGVVVVDLRTGTRRVLPDYNAEAPKVTNKRYVVYSAGSETSIKLYDRHTGKLRTLVPANSKGYGVGNYVKAAEHMVLFQQGKPCGDPNFVCPGRLAAMRMP